MQFTDTQRLDFLEKWETSSHQDSWFTLLTQHVRKADCPTLREFCDYAIRFEQMIDQNGLDIMAWHFLPYHLQELVINLWENDARPMNEDERSTLQEESAKYWEELHQTEKNDSDK
jgi:hypothetical protein